MAPQLVAAPAPQQPADAQDADTSEARDVWDKEYNQFMVCGDGGAQI